MNISGIKNMSLNQISLLLNIENKSIYYVSESLYRSGFLKCEMNEVAHLNGHLN